MAAAVCSCGQIAGSFHKRENTQCCASCTCIAGCCSQSCSYTWSLGADLREQGLNISFSCGNKLLLPGARPGSKTNFLVAKLDIHCLRNENILILYIVFPQQSCRGHIRLCSWTHYKHYTKMHAWSCTKLTIPRIYGSSKCLLPHEHPGSKWENMVAFATIATTNFEPWVARSVCGGTNLMSHYCHHHSVERRPPAETFYSWTCRYSRRLWYIAAPDVWW